MKTLNTAMARVLKRLHYPLDVILTCVRWGTVNLLADVRPNTQYVRIANLIGKALQHRSARHAFPRLEGLGA